MFENTWLVDLVVGYEYHDDYIQTARYSVTYIDEARSFAETEELITQLVLDELTDPFESSWWRIDSIARMPELEPVVDLELMVAEGRF